MGYLVQWFINSVIYLIAIILSITIYRVFDRKSNKVQIIDILMIVLLIVITGLRYGVGTDYEAYYNIFNNIPHKYSNIIDIITESFQFGFVLLGYMLKGITSNEYAIFWLVSIIVYPFMIIYFRKKTEISWLAFATFMLMGFFDVSMNILKQQIAMVLLLIAYEQLIKQKKTRFLILIVLAGVFHITAIVGGLLIYISRYIKPTFRNLLISIFVGIIGYFSYKLILLKLFSYNTIFSKYEMYLIYQDISVSSREARELSIIGYVIVFTLITIILLNYKMQLKEILKERYRMISMLFIGIAISIISIDYWVINRIALYLYQFIIVLIPAFFKINMPKKEKQMYTIVFTLIMVGWFFVFFIIGGNNLSFTYKTYLFK